MIWKVTTHPTESKDKGRLDLHEGRRIFMARKTHLPTLTLISTWKKITTMEVNPKIPQLTREDVRRDNPWN